MLAMIPGLGDRLRWTGARGILSDAAAVRWKTQINENAKMPAWSSLLPELDHHEIVGREMPPDVTPELVGVGTIEN